MTKCTGNFASCELHGYRRVNGRVIFGKFGNCNIGIHMRLDVKGKPGQTLFDCTCEICAAAL